MSHSALFPGKVAFVTDDINMAQSAIAGLSALLPVEVLVWEHLEKDNLSLFDIIIMDINIERGENVRRYRKTAEYLLPETKVIFTVDTSRHNLMTQANALGATCLIARPINQTQLISAVSEMTISLTSPPKTPIQLANDACLTIADLMDELTLATRRGAPLPLDQMHDSCEGVIEAVSETKMETFLNAVRTHSSFTYRHVMIVTGFAALFGVKFNMARDDLQRLTLGALLHDIGKIKIPTRILDKPGKLSPKEMKIMREHPLKGSQILEKDGRFSRDIIMIVRNHHELLDGTGYPDQLSASQIPDIVRVMTVVDIFSALVEARSYKVSLPMDVAFGMLVDMGGKLDQDIVRGFEPIALNGEADKLVKLVRDRAA